MEVMETEKLATIVNIRADYDDFAAPTAASTVDSRNLDAATEAVILR